MGSDLEVVPAMEAHARELAPRLRPRDVDEVRDSGGYSPLEALTVSVQWSTYARALLEDGRVIAMWGVAPLPDGTLGAVWLLGSPELDHHPRLFLKLARPEVEHMAGMFLGLTNYVSASNTASVRWLKRLGFTVAEPRPWGRARKPFRHFFLLGRPARV